MMFGDARDRLTFFRLQLRASERERERGELCTIMEKDVGKPQVFFCCNLFCTHSLLGCIEVVGSGSSSRTASLTSAGNSRVLGSVGRL